MSGRAGFFWKKSRHAIYLSEITHLFFLRNMWVGRGIIDERAGIYPQPKSVEPYTIVSTDDATDRSTDPDWYVAVPAEMEADAAAIVGREATPTRPADFDSGDAAHNNPGIRFRVASGADSSADSATFSDARHQLKGE
jgi:hypothetical protein